MEATEHNHRSLLASLCSGQSPNTGSHRHSLTSEDLDYLPPRRSRRQYVDIDYFPNGDGLDDLWSNPMSSGDVKDENRKQKRKEQNRVAQRAYRERKLHHIYELEDTIKRLENKITTLQTENRDLNVDINRTRSENAVLRVAVFENRTLRSDEVNIPAIPDRTGPKTGVLLSDLLLMSDRQTVFEKRRQIGI